MPYLFIKLALQDFSPAAIAWGRITLAAAVLVPIAWKRGVLGPVFAHKRAVIAFGLAELAVPFSLVAMGEQWISSSLTGILIATVPLTVVIIAPLFGVREPLGARRLIGLAIGFLGVVTILGLDTGHGPMLWAGVVCMLISVVGYAVGPLVVERYLADVDELGALAGSLVVAMIALFPVALMSAPRTYPQRSRSPPFSRWDWYVRRSRYCSTSISSTQPGPRVRPWSRTSTLPSRRCSAYSCSLSRSVSARPWASR